jgi:hypothetical protein
VGGTLPRSQERSIPGMQDAPDDVVEVTEGFQDNPWASESGDDRSAALRTQQQLSSRPRKARITTLEANVRPSRQQRTTQPDHRGPARSRLDNLSRKPPNSKINSSRSRRQPSPETDSDDSNSSEPHSDYELSHSDDGSGSTEDHGDDAVEREISRLQRRLASLQHGHTNPESGEDKPAPAKPWKVLHEVECLNTRHLATYLDEPELENDRDLGHLHWQGTKHVTNLKAWTRKQKHPFIVYRMYHCVHEREEVSEPREKIIVLSGELDHAIMSWLEATSGLAIYKRDGVYANNELEAPYLCFYHFQHEARQVLSSSGSWSQDALPLLEFLNTSTAAIAREAETMFASGKVTAKLMPYLFKPGALVCFEESGDFVVCEQVSLLNMSSHDADSQPISCELFTVRIAFDGKFRRLRSFRHRINLAAVGDQPLNIADLSVQPLSSIPSERRAELKRRGDIFMKCREQLYVTYPSGGGQQDFVCHHHCRLTRTRTSRS